MMRKTVIEILDNNNKPLILINNVGEVAFSRLPFSENGLSKEYVNFVVDYLRAIDYYDKDTENTILSFLNYEEEKTIFCS